MFRLSFIAVPLVLVVLVAPVGVQALTLQESLVLAYQQNPELMARRKELMATDEQVPQAYSGWLPDVSLSMDYGRVKEKSPLITRDIYDTRNDRQLSVVQPIFRGGGNFARTKRAHNAVYASREQLRSLEQDILNQTVVTHADVARTYQVYLLSENNENVLKEQKKSTHERFELGETTKTDVAQSEARYAQAISDTTRAKGQLETAFAAYLKIIGEADKEKIPAPKEFVMPSGNVVVPDSLLEAIKVALENNPILKSQKYQEEIAKSDKYIAYSEMLPDVSLRGDMIRRNTRDAFPSSITDTDSVTVNVTVPLYQSGAEYSRVRAAKRSEENTRLLTIETTNRIRQNVISSWENIQTFRSTIKSNKQAVEAATIALDGVKQEMEVGSRTVLDVLDAEQELFNAKVDLVNSRRNLIVALYNLRLSIGSLTAKDIELPVNIYDPTKHFDNVKYQFIGF